jgi:hypothetical protein
MMKKDFVCLFLILLSGILINFQLFTGNIPFDFDNLAFYHPLFSLAQLRPLVLWDNFQFSGFPVFAEPQFAMFYPLRWLFNFVNIFPAMPLFYILHYVLGLGFMYLFLRSLNLGRIAATGGTFCFIHGSYLQAKLMMSGTLFYSMVWIPLFFLFAFRAINKPSFRNAVYAGWILGIIALIGSPHHLFYPVLAVFIYILFSIKRNKYEVQSTKYKISSFFLLLLIVVIGIGIGAIQLIPGQELFIRSIRANLPFDQVVETPLKTHWILGSFLGGTQTPEFLDASAYFGVAGLILILFAFFKPGNNKLYLWFWLTIAILAILIARGQYTPFYHIFYQLPFLKSLSFPCRSLILLAFSGAVLTAYGIETAIQRKKVIRISEYQDEGNQKIRIPEKMQQPDIQICRYPLPDNLITRYSLLIVYFLLLTSLAFLMFFYFRFGNILIQTLLYTKWADPLLYRWTNLALFTFLTAVVLLLYWKNKLGLRTFQILILAILFADLFQFTPRIHKRFINGKEYLALPQSAEFLQEVSAQSGQSAGKDPVRFIGFHGSRLYAIDQNDNRFRAYLAPKLADLYRLQDAQGYDPLMLQKYVTLMDKFAGRSQTEDPQRMATVATCESRFLNLLNIGYIVGEVNEVSIHRSPLIIPTGVKTTLTVSIDTSCVELGMISLLDQHLQTPQGTQIGTITVTGSKGEQEILPIRAGIETADWRTETTPGAHFMPREPAMSWIGNLAGKEFRLHNFYIRFKFAKPFIPKTINVTHAQLPGVLVIQHLTLIKQNDENHFKKLADFGDVRIYQNKTVYPRAFLVHQVEIIPDETKLLAKLAVQTTDLRDTAYLKEPIPLALIAHNSNFAPDSVNITKYLPNRIELETASDHNSFLVLSEIAYPGWRAFIDGNQAKIYTTDYILRGLYLEPGKHSIIFKFQPLSLYLGAGITLLTLLGSLLGIIISKPAGKVIFPHP